MSRQTIPLKYEIINIRIEKDPNNINIVSCFIEAKKWAYTKLSRQHKDVPCWSYKDLKTYDQKIS